MSARHLLPTLLLVACSDPAQVAEVGSVTWTLGPEPELSVGVIEGEAEYELFRVQSAARLSDGTLVIANVGSYELRFYDSNGKHIRSVGRKGEGPGEFEWLHSTHVIRGDSIVVWDHLQRRATVFSPDGSLGRDFVPDLSGQSVTLNSLTLPASPSEIVFRRDGSFLVIPSIPLWALSGLRTNDEGFGYVEPNSVAADGIWRAEHSAYVFHPDGARSAVTQALPSSEWVVLGGMMQPRLFGHRLHIAAGESRFVVSTGRDGRLLQVGLGGDTTAIPLDIPARAATDAIRDAELNRVFRVYAESDRERVAALLTSVGMPDSLPSMGVILVDDQGRIWAEEFLTRVERESASHIRWHVLSGDGDHIAQVEVPASLTVTDVSHGYLTGYQRDDFDVERVHSYTINSTGGAF